MSEVPSTRGKSSHAGRLARCERCGMHLRLCLCAELRPLALATRVLVIRSAREAPQPTNTGRLVPLTLGNAAVLARGRDAEPLRPEELAEPGRRALLLCPGPCSRELVRDDDPRSVTLVVPDGTWRKARRMAAREPALARLERVHLPAGPPSRYRLRAHPDGSCLATFEAVARALGILEGADVQARLEQVFARFVDRTLFSRGRLAKARVTGGVPPAPGAYSGWLETRAEPSSS